MKPLLVNTFEEHHEASSINRKARQKPNFTENLVKHIDTLIQDTIMAAKVVNEQWGETYKEAKILMSIQIMNAYNYLDNLKTATKRGHRCSNVLAHKNIFLSIHNLAVFIRGLTHLRRKNPHTATDLI